MGVCLNHKEIKCFLLFDDEAIKDNKIQNSINNNDEDKSKYSIEKNKEINFENSKNEKDTIKLNSIKNIEEKDKIGSNTEKIINFKIQSKYRAKFFSNSITSLNSTPNKNIFETIKTNNNNENCEKFIYFTNLNERGINAGNAGASTASNSYIK